MMFVNTIVITNRQNSTFFARILVSCISSRVHKPHSVTYEYSSKAISYVTS